MLVSMYPVHLCVSVRFAVGISGFGSLVERFQTLRIVFISSLFNAPDKMLSMKKEAASLIVVSLGDALYGIHPSSCDRHWCLVEDCG